MSDELKKIIKDSSPWGKYLTAPVVFKAWALSMAFSLKSVGKTQEEVCELLSDAKYGFDYAAISKMVRTVFSEDIKNQATDQKFRRVSSKELEVNQ